MSTLAARFTQSPEEVKRYVLDYSLFVSSGETISGASVSITNLGTPPNGSPPLVVNNIVIAPGNLQVLFFVSGGVSGQAYEATFLATTSVGQVLQDVIEFDIVEKT